MPLILALVLALSAAILSYRMTQATQVLIERLEIHQYADQGGYEAYYQLQLALESLSSSKNSQSALKALQDKGWHVEESGRFFNPLLWIGWSEEQRGRFTRGLYASSMGRSWLERLENIKRCLPEKIAEQRSAFNRCTELPLLEGMALFPDPTPLNINEASVALVKLMLPEASSSHWTSFERERQEAPFSSMNDFSSRLPEIVSVSPLTGGFDVQSRYVWLRWNRANTTMLWLIDRQGTSSGSHILFNRES